MELRRKIIDGRPSHYLYEWNPGNGRWYSINSKNIWPESLSDPNFVAAYRGRMNVILRGGTVSVVGEYDRSTRKLTVQEVN